MSQCPTPARPARQPVIDRLLASRDALLRGARRRARRGARAGRAHGRGGRARSRDGGTGSPAVRGRSIALGGYGAGRLLPGSDLDLLIALRRAAPRASSRSPRPSSTRCGTPGSRSATRCARAGSTCAACANDLATLTRVAHRPRRGGRRRVRRTRCSRDVAAARDARPRARAARSCPHGRAPRLAVPARARPEGGRRRPARPRRAHLDRRGALGRARARHRAARRARPARPPSEVAAPRRRRRGARDGALGAAPARRAAPRPAHPRGGRGPRRSTSKALTGGAAPTSRSRSSACAGASPGPPSAAALSTPEALFARARRGPRRSPPLEAAAWTGELEPLVPGLARAHAAASARALAHASPSARTASPPRPTSPRPPGATTFAAAAPRDAARHAARSSRRRSTHDFGQARARTRARRARRRRRPRRPRRARHRRGRGRRRAPRARAPPAAPRPAARADVADEDAVLRVAAAHRPTRARRRRCTCSPSPTRSRRAPDRWTPWRAALVGDLAMRLDDALTAEVEGAGVARDAAATRGAALALLPPGDGAALARSSKGAPLRYLAATAPPRRRAATPRSPPRSSACGTTAAAAAWPSASAPPMTWRVTVATLDRPGLFATARRRASRSPGCPSSARRRSRARRARPSTCSRWSPRRSPTSTRPRGPGSSARCAPRSAAGSSSRSRLARAPPALPRRPRSDVARVVASAVTLGAYATLGPRRGRRPRRPAPRPRARHLGRRARHPLGHGPHAGRRGVRHLPGDDASGEPPRASAVLASAVGA